MSPPSTNTDSDRLLRDTFSTLQRRENLSADDAEALFGALAGGAIPDAAVGAVLGAFVVKGESVEEIVGAVRAMRARAIPIRCDDPDAIDTCGTGGDGTSTFNVSTTAAIVAAAAGATVAKHGNRSTTRVSGSSEVLSALGIDIEAEEASVERCLREVGIAYLNARKLHPAMKTIAPFRHAIPVRTIFNLLGPLTNPAGVRRQLIGVPNLQLLDRIAQALLKLGAIHAWVVHGHNALCDISVTGPSSVCEVRNGTIRSFQITPGQVGLPVGELDDLRVSSPGQSADAIRAILNGEKSSRRNHALLNAGAALVVAGKADDFAAGVERAMQAIDNGAASAKLQEWRKYQGPGTKDQVRNTKDQQPT